MLENLSGETRLFPIIGDPIVFVIDFMLHK